jgi:alanyl-tRNA synthetase
MPSGKQRGYILRRLMRRLLSKSLSLGIDIQNPDYYRDLVESVISIYEGVYPEVSENKDKIIELYITEAKKFTKAIKIGKKEWAKILKTKL